VSLIQWIKVIFGGLVSVRYRDVKWSASLGPPILFTTSGCQCGYHRSTILVG